MNTSKTGFMTGVNINFEAFAMILSAAANCRQAN
jgi:hypothetical protein